MNITILHTKIKQDKKGLFCINDIHDASGGEKSKQPFNWFRLNTTKELIKELEQSSEVRSGQKVIEIVNGGNSRGTYVCKELVYAYTMWINAKFHLYVIRTFDNAIRQDVKRQQIRDTARVEYKPMTDAIKAERDRLGKETRQFDFSNEANLINRIALGMTASKFKDINDIGKNEPIRDHLTPCQIKCVTDLQRANTTFIQLGMEYEERKTLLMEMFKRNHIIPLFDEQQRLAA